MIMIIKRREMRNCFNNILIALNICDSLHLIFAIMDAVRNSFGQKYLPTSRKYRIFQINVWHF